MAGDMRDRLPGSDCMTPINPAADPPGQTGRDAGRAHRGMMIGPHLSAWLRGHHVALALCLVFLLWANIETPMWADDYCRALDPSVSAAISSAWHDYFTWTGRFFVNALTYALMGAGWRWSMLPFDALNALVFIGLIVLVMRLAALASGQERTARRDRTAEFVDALFIALLLWWGPRSVGEAALWKTGSIGYLWAVAGELFILERALALAVRGTASPTLWLTALFAFVMATFLEPLSVVVSAALCLLAMWAWQGQRPQRWLLTVAACHVAGSVVLLAAPGNFVRAAAVATMVGPSPLTARIGGAIDALGKVFGDGYVLAGFAFAVLSFQMPEAWMRRIVGPLAPATKLPTGGGRARPPLRAGIGWLFVVLALLYVATLLAIPRALIAARVTYAGSVLVICYIASLFQLRPLTPARNVATAAILFVLAASPLPWMVRDLRAIAAIDRGWTEVLTRAPPGATVVLPMIHGRHGTLAASRYRFFEGFTQDPGYFINRCYARAWGMAKIVGR